MTASTKKVLQTVSYVGLALSVIPAFLVFGGVLAKETYLRLLFLGMVLWFSTAVFWIKKDRLG